MAHQVRDPYLPLIHAETHVLYSTDKDTAKGMVKGMVKDTVKVKVKVKDLLATVHMAEDSLTRHLPALLPEPILCAFCSQTLFSLIMGSSPQFFN